MKKHLYYQKILCLLLLTISITILGISKYFTNNLIKQEIYSKTKRSIEIDNDVYSRNDSNYTKCVNRTIDEFPKDFFTPEQNKKGAIIVHIVITFYLFGALAIVCDEYFVKALELIAKNLNMKPDVAGATFMAAGSSAPELFTSIIGVTIAKSDVGLGTIVGSAVFNVLFIIALCAMVARTSLYLDWYPLTRDCLFYTISVGALIAVIHDEKVHWYEATILLIMYFVYIIIMYFNNRIEKFVKLNINIVKYYENEDEISNLLSSNSNSKLPIDRPHSVTRLNSLDFNVDNEMNRNRNEENDENKYDDDDDDDGDDEPINPFKIPRRKTKKLIWAIFLPANLLFYFTVPDCRRKIFSKFPYYFFTFIMSTIYLGVLTYVLVWMVVIIAYTINMPDTVAGLTLLAAGTSLPEIVSGIIVTRKGKGDMAISNSIGSNIFDVLMCLALPWFISTVIIDTNSVVEINSGGITYSTIILFSTIIALIVLIFLNKFILTKKLGVLLFIIWILVTILQCLFELNIFGKYSLPFCT